MLLLDRTSISPVTAAAANHAESEGSADPEFPVEKRIELPALVGRDREPTPRHIGAAPQSHPRETDEDGLPQPSCGQLLKLIKQHVAPDYWPVHPNAIVVVPAYGLVVKAPERIQQSVSRFVDAYMSWRKP